MPGFLAFETEVVVKASLLFFWVSFLIRMASTSIVLGSFFFGCYGCFCCLGRQGMDCLILWWSHRSFPKCVWSGVSVCTIFSTVFGMVSIKYILFMSWVGIPLEKKLIKMSWLVILLRAALFLNFDMYSRRLSFSLTLVVDSHAMAWSFVFLRMNKLLNLLRKSLQVPKPGGLLAKAVSV